MIYEHWKNHSLEDIEGERWKPVPGYEGTLASNLGRIKKLSRYVKVCHGGKRFLKVAISHQVKSKDGYLRTEAVLNGKCKKVTAHRMCALAWKTNPENKKTVQHDNNIRHCNEEWNLKWFTQSEQLFDTYKKERRVSKVQNYVKHGKDHYLFGVPSQFRKSVSQHSKDGVLIKTYPSILSALKATGINGISRAIKDPTSSAGGFIWKRLEVQL